MKHAGINGSKLLPTSHSNGSKAKTPARTDYLTSPRAREIYTHRQLQQLLRTIKEYQQGNFSTRCPVRGGIVGEIGDILNGIITVNQQKAKEFARVAKSVAYEGKMTERVERHIHQGEWATTINSVNSIINDLGQLIREVARVITSVAKGDLSQKMILELNGRPLKGEFSQIARTVNIMVDQLNSFAAEVTRVAKEVGTEGKLGGQAEVKGVSGTWKDLTDNVNGLAGNLTMQVRNIAKVTTAVAKGDLSQKITVDARGEILELKNTINTMVDQLNSFAAEVTRVAKEVGTEGKLGGQADVKGVSGTWKGLTDNVNSLAGNLTTQVRNIAKVTTAVAKGDLSQKITVDARGEILELKNTINTMVDQLNSFAAEVTRVAKEVGTEGKLGGQADVKGVSGTWKGLTDNVNSLAGNLTTQVRNIAKVTTAVAKGDLSQKITVDARGEILELKNTINIMVDQLNSFAAEVTRVAKEVGTEGKLGGQADVKGVSGTWKDLTDNVNFMASNLTKQVRGISKVVTAVATGDLNQKFVLEAKGEVATLAETITSMIDTLRTFADQVTSVAREVGFEGKLGGQAKVPGAAGTWKDLTDNVNSLAGNLTMQVRNIAKVTTAVAKGDLSQKITVDARGEILELKNTINTMVDQLNSFAAEVTRVAKEVGTEGELGGQADVKGVSGTWKNLTDNVNFMASNLTKQVRGISKVVTAVATGDLNQKFVLEAKGEVATLAETINSMIDTLRTFADQVTTVAREVGFEGKLGGQAKVPGAAGTWKDLTDNVNFMAGNLTKQVRGISKVVTAVATGDLNQKFVLEAKGEVATLAETINSMIDTLRTFADQVTTVAREVGFEGQLGGQAKVPGAAGTWKDLTDNVNQLAANLTAQVRAIAEVSTAVTRGDLTRSISVQARGEVAALKDNINQMISNLKDTTDENNEQDWLKTNMAKFSGMMQGQRSITEVAQLIMSELTPLVNAQYGAFFMSEGENAEQELNLKACYGFPNGSSSPRMYHYREGLVGQCAYDRKRILLGDLPDDFVRINSALGGTKPKNLVILPVLFEGELEAVIELASLQPFRPVYLTFLSQLMDSIGVVLNVISSTMRTEELLQAVKRSNTELETQAKELEEKAKLLELKNREVEEASLSLEEKAEQLAMISKYKSEFLANMSHELRTPLNSLLILSKLLSENKERNLSTEQVKFADTIYSSGCDLLSLINEILDLSKVEAGKMQVEPQDVQVTEIQETLEQTFRPVAEHKGLQFLTVLKPGLPATLFTDRIRLHQILKNLLSNALKFTERGEVSVEIYPASPQHVRGIKTDGHRLIAFAVRDTGIGIPEAKQELIFEAFQQADGTTNRKYGGTGLGLTISREIARLLGGAIEVQSKAGAGSTFTLYLPDKYTGAEAAPRPSVPEQEIPIPPLPADANFTNKQILIIDDDQRNILAIRSLLEKRGIQVSHADNGKDGIQYLKDHPDLDMVIMDVMMPHMNGMEATRIIRHQPEFKNLPIICLTAKAMREDRDKCLEAGASDYITKPVDPDKLLSRIYNWLKPTVN